MSVWYKSKCSTSIVPLHIKKVPISSYVGFYKCWYQTLQEGPKTLSPILGTGMKFLVRSCTHTYLEDLGPTDLSAANYRLELIIFPFYSCPCLF
jgi:hypothetical protein